MLTVPDRTDEIEVLAAAAVSVAVVLAVVASVLAVVAVARFCCVAARLLSVPLTNAVRI